MNGTAHPALEILKSCTSARADHLSLNALTDITDYFDQSLCKAEEELTPDMSERDRFFEIMIQRFEAMQAHKDSVLALAELCKKSPEHARRMLECNRRSLTKMFALTLPDRRKEPGLIETGLLFFIYHATFYSFETDASDSLQCTMKKLNSVLARTEKILFSRL